MHVVKDRLRSSFVANLVASFVEHPLKSQREPTKLAIKLPTKIGKFRLTTCHSGPLHNASQGQVISRDRSLGAFLPSPHRVRKGPAGCAVTSEVVGFQRFLDPVSISSNLDETDETIMQVFTANDAKQKFGELLDQALQHPVSITRHGRPSVVVTSDAEYRELLALKYESLKSEVRKGFEGFDRGESSARTVDDIAEAVLKRNLKR
jgi:prevent-host-death family protein